jgi:hypothetical protein
MGTGVRTEGELLDRGPELASLRAAVDTAASGAGGGVFLEGEAGIGKTRLLRALADMGEEAGFTVLAARAGELERDFAWGVARQLFEAHLLAEPEDSRADLLSSAAANSRAALGMAEATEEGAASPQAVADASFAARITTVRNFTTDGVTGENHFLFGGGVGGRKLEPGSYELLASAADASGHTDPATPPVRFEIVR